MGDNVGRINLDLELSEKKFNRQFSRIDKTAKNTAQKLARSINQNVSSIENKVRGSSKGIMSSLKGIAVTAVAAFSVKKITSFGKSCLDLGSDLAEVQNVVDVVFTTMSDKVNNFAKGAATQFGLSETMAKQYTGLYGAMAKAYGFAEKQVLDMSTTLTGLAGDTASFYNIEQDLAYTKLKSVFSGETETLKDLGIVMTQSALDAYALANGFGRTTKDMTEAEKVTLRLQFVQEKLSSAQGDFARTSDSWANQTRLLSLRFDSLKATLGQGLINVLGSAVKMLNSLVEKLQSAAEAFRQFTESVFGKWGDEGNGAGFATETSDALLGAADSSSGITSELEKSNKEAKKLKNNLMGFDELNILSQEDTSDTSSDTGGIATSDIAGMNNEAKKTNSLIDKLNAKFKSLYKSLNLDKLVGKFKKFGTSISKQISKYDFGKPLMGAVENALKLVVSSLNLAAGIVFPIAVALDIPGIVHEGLKTLEALFGALNQVVVAVTPGIEKFVQIGLVPIATWVGEKIKDVLSFLQEQLQKIGDWFSEHEEMFTNIGTTLGELTAKIWTLLEPIADTAWETFKGIVITLVDVFLQLSEKIGGFIEKVLVAYNAVIDFANELGILEAISGTVQFVFENLGESIESIFKMIGESLGHIMDALGGLVDFISGVFTGDWKKAWEGIKTFVKGIWLAIWTIIKGFVNQIINGMNILWNGIYDVVKGIVDSIGGVAGALGDVFGQDWHFSMPEEPPQIPKLAKGGLVTAPTLALVGDNPNASADPEVVAPLSKLQGMMNGSSSAEDTGTLKQILAYLIKLYDLAQYQELNFTNVINLDGEKIDRQLVRIRKVKNTRYNGGVT